MGKLRSRFLQHHALLLAYLDRLEDALASLEKAGELPAVSVPLETARVIREVVDFLERWEAQHEAEEERILVPLLREAEVSHELKRQEILETLHAQHVEGGRIFEAFRSSCRADAGAACPEGAVAADFAERARELIEHFRRHVEFENACLLEKL